MKFRALLTILLSIAIGFVVGFASSSLLSKQRTKDVYSLSSMKRFKERSYSIIDADSAQKKVIGPIVDKYAVISDSIKRQSYNEFKNLIKSFHKELEPYLDKDQMQRLYDFPKHIHKSKAD
jgi:uncharacterized membrane protein YraQ (UPF0718 family)